MLFRVGSWLGSISKSDLFEASSSCLCFILYLVTCFASFVSHGFGYTKLIVLVADGFWQGDIVL
jgi:hypothetical protein